MTKSEFEKCMDGDIFNCTNAELLKIINKARELPALYNATGNRDTLRRNTARVLL